REQVRQPRGQFGRNLSEGHEVPGARGTLNLERIAVVVVIALQRFDQQVIDREPDRATPVRASAEQVCVRLARRVFDGVLRAVVVERERRVQVYTRQGPNSIRRQEFVLVQHVLE